MSTTMTHPPGTDQGFEPGLDQPQYSLAQIIGIWAAATVPMGVILWVVMPLIAERTTVDPGLMFLPLITGGLVWQGVLAYLILRREVVPFTWANLQQRLWLNPPLRPGTGTPSWKLLWVTFPIAVVVLVWDIADPLGFLNDWWVDTLPFLEPPDYALIENLAEPAVGQWWLLGLLVVLIMFNYLIGEELIFRGVLLPRMYGRFGRWTIAANGVLFATYHVHLIWALPSTIIVRDWVYAWATQRYRSYWASALVHGYDALALIVLFPLAIMGHLDS
jgi:membrane protease YdiL (CAAX protease family)